MAHISCGNCRKYHATTLEVKICHLGSKIADQNADKTPPPIPTLRGAARVVRDGLRVIHHADPATKGQIDGIVRRCKTLRLDAQHVVAQVANKGQADAVIKTLQQRIDSMDSTSDSSAGKAEPAIQLPARMARMVKPGYYALRIDENHHWFFFRVSCPATGYRKGVLKFQTIHGENMRDRIEYQVDGRITKCDDRPIDGMPLRDWITMLIPIQAEAAIEYTTHKNTGRAF